MDSLKGSLLKCATASETLVITVPPFYACPLYEYLESNPTGFSVGPVLGLDRGEMGEGTLVSATGSGAYRLGKRGARDLTCLCIHREEYGTAGMLRYC